MTFTGGPLPGTPALQKSRQAIVSQSYGEQDACAQSDCQTCMEFVLHDEIKMLTDPTRQGKAEEVVCMCYDVLQDSMTEWKCQQK